jgi:tRNA (mo5U34)-methyltransferase
MGGQGVIQGAYIDRKEAQALVDGHAWWYHTFEIYPGIWTPGVYDASGTLKELNLPNDMKGKRVLEIGPADGYFTKVLSERGATVVALDYAGKGHFGFEVMEQLSGRTFDFRKCNVFDIDSTTLGVFDVVICLGVLYHLPDPVRGLWKLSGIETKRFILETLISTKYGDQCVAEYLPGISPNGDYTNFWAPTSKCCEKILEDIGFRVESIFLNETRAMFRCSTVGQELPSKKMRVAYSSIEL